MVIISHVKTFDQIISFHDKFGSGDGQTNYDRSFIDAQSENKMLQI